VSRAISTLLKRESGTPGRSAAPTIAVAGNRGGKSAAAALRIVQPIMTKLAKLESETTESSAR
jgi:hypothetical protein